MFLTGLIIFLVGLTIVVLTFYPVIWQEISYNLKNINSLNFPNTLNSKIIEPVNKDFTIVIPKISANSRVIDNVDPFNSKEYQVALTRGVAHARGTAYPGEPGNDFIFAHSSENWYIANRYNSVFYLLDKLVTGDEIDIYYKTHKYIYKVFSKKIVSPTEISYLNPSGTGRSRPTPTLTLMTCWPPGTTLNRLIIQANIIQ